MANEATKTDKQPLIVDSIDELEWVVSTWLFTCFNLIVYLFCIYLTAQYDQSILYL